MITQDITTDEGTIRVRGLKRGEIKALKAQGINFGGQIPFEKIEENTTAALKIILPPEMSERIDDFYEADLLELHRAMIALTYPTPDETKNSASQ